MGKRGRILIFALAIIAVGAVGWLIFRAAPDPLYKGKPLSYWLQGYRPGFTSLEPPPSSQEADAAIHQTGTNAIPMLLEMLQSRDSPLKIKLMSWAYRIPYVRSHSRRPVDKNFEGYCGLRTLGPDAAPAIPELIKILNQNSGSNTMEYAAAILGAMGPVAADTVPTLLLIATGTNQNARNSAIFALGAIHSHSDKVVPFLIAALHDSSPDVRATAAGGLGRFGTNAEPAVPKLVEIISEPAGGSNSLTVFSSKRYTVRIAAENALNQIDLKTYSQLHTNTATRPTP